MLAFTGCVGEKEPENIGKTVGEGLPQFSVILDDGSQVSTTSLRGKVAVIEFFNTSCADCRRAFPVLQNLYERYRDNEEVMIFAIARDEDASAISSYWRQNGLSVPYSPQKGREVYELFATVGIPRIFIADREGVITACYGPEDEPSATTLANAAEEALLR